MTWVMPSVRNSLTSRHLVIRLPKRKPLGDEGSFHGQRRSRPARSSSIRKDKSSGEDRLGVLEDHES